MLQRGAINIRPQDDFNEIGLRFFIGKAFLYDFL